MPLRAEVRALYGAEWRRFREEYAQQHPPICRKCGQRHPRINLAHDTHDPHRRDKIGWLCPSDHAKNDTAQRLAMTRRTHARKVGQLWLLPEVEFAPFALWEIPEDQVADVLKALQEELFT